MHQTQPDNILLSASLMHSVSAHSAVIEYLVCSRHWGSSGSLKRQTPEPSEHFPKPFGGVKERAPLGCGSATREGRQEEKVPKTKRTAKKCYTLIRSLLVNSNTNIILLKLLCGCICVYTYI